MNHPRKISPILPSQRPLVYLITNRKAFRQTPVSQSTETKLQLEAIRTAVDAGCRLLQVRERDLEASDLARLVTAAIKIARPSGARVLVNDRLDVALATGADGVHLRVSSLTVSQVRSIVSNIGRADLLIGVSTHSVEEAVKASIAADFIVAGPIFETESKMEFGPPLGLTRFTEIVDASKVPVLGIGGVNLDNFGSVLECGAAGIAGIGLFSTRDSAAENVRRILTSDANRRRAGRGRD